MRPKIIYFAYPYSDNPLERTEEIKEYIRDLCKVRTDIVPIVPHTTFDAIWDYPSGYSNHFIDLNMGVWEFEIIARADYICFPPPKTPAKRLCGVVWEGVFAKWFGTPMVDWFYLIEEGEI